MQTAFVQSTPGTLSWQASEDIRKNCSADDRYTFELCATNGNGVIVIVTML
jgi:hypothetical protein